MKHMYETGLAVPTEVELSLNDTNSQSLLQQKVVEQVQASKHI